MWGGGGLAGPHVKLGKKLKGGGGLRRVSSRYKKSKLRLYLTLNLHTYTHTHPHTRFVFTLKMNTNTPVYSRKHWIAHYDAMKPCFTQLTEYGPDPWRGHRTKHGNQPWWEPRWATLAYGQTQWTGCDEGLHERRSMRCHGCYQMREDHADSTGAKEYIWCRNCPCGCESLETCYEFPDHGESRAQHATTMQSVLSAISS